MKESSELTLEQLEQQLAQRVITLYQTLLGHQLQQVSCNLVDKTVTILAEDSLTHIEQFLDLSARRDLAIEVRNSLHKALEPHLQSLIEELVHVPVVNVICNAAFDTGHISIVSVLAATPELIRLHSLRQVVNSQKPENVSSRDDNK